MHKAGRVFIGSLFLFFTLFLLNSFAVDESITFTTYYPSPTGSYHELRSARMAIGDTYINPATFSWDSTPATIDANADLVVEGNVGVGTTDPGAPLDVRGAPVVDGQLSSQVFVQNNLTAYNASPKAGIDFGWIYKSDGTVGQAGGIALGKLNTADADYSSYLALYTANIGSSVTERLRIDNVGNVGIGTDNPNSPLTIRRTFTSGPMLSLESNLHNANGDYSMIQWGDHTQSVNYHKGAIIYENRDGLNGPTRGNLHIALNAAGDSSNVTLSDARLTVTYGGRVGIGTTAPGDKMEVSGGATAYSVGGLSLTGGDQENTITPIGRIYAYYTDAGWDKRQLRFAVGQTGAIGVADAMTINAGGNVGIGTTGPKTNLHIYKGSLGSYPTTHQIDTYDLATIENSDHVRLNFLSPANKHNVITFGDPDNKEAGFIRYQHDSDTLDFKVNGAIVFSIDKNGNVSGGPYSLISDIRFKKDIVTIPEALEKVLALRGVNFRWKDKPDDAGLRMGMIAQEVERIVPEVVHINAQGIKSVEYQVLVGLLVEAIKEQEKKIGSQEQEIKSLGEKITKLEKK